ncbi:hypothetical protein [Nodularia sp. UHCC 0506]|uniref:hypothetical protein n=1 Tax=Nodularia sp. UHCC 0506 TaxID=3110243 RepID=UPI002B2030FD|nr:hypothetical protein [Nodularia sp. UHCC 0506]MEA5513702.1 hypothetical protein [Nodularia sp. UHCC 0506]
MLSSLDLIREFVQSSTQKKDVLLSNPSLTAETIYKSNQLTAKTEGVIATYQLNHRVSEFWVNPNSSHWDLINEALADHNYLIKGKIETDHRGFYRYQYFQIPKGYKAHCTKSVMLWRAWWKYRKSALKSGIPLELLIQKRESWYPVRDLNISNGLLYIKTLGSEIVLHSDDLVIWLSKNEVTSAT